MMETGQKSGVSLNRSLLIVLLLSAFALGAVADRLFLIIGAHPAEEPEGLRRTAARPKEKRLDSLRTALEGLLVRKLARRDAVNVSLYLQDLRSGAWIGIDQDKQFSPSNFLRLPVMMAYFKLAEADPALLKKMLPFHGPGSASPPNIRPARRLMPGSSYSVEELLYRMTAQNDQDSFFLLSGNLPGNALGRLYEALHINASPDSDDALLTLKDYAVFFRSLYHASYLDHAMSEKALKYLSRSSFRSGIVAGVPPNVGIASRSGERSLQDGTRKIIQLYEIGIVYAADRPYLIGVMAAGEDFQKLARVIRDISRTAYKEIDSQSRGKRP